MSRAAATSAVSWIPARILLAVLFFTFVGGAGAWVPFLALHLDRLGHGGAAIGGLLALIPVARMLSAPLWSYFADRYRSSRLLLRLATALSVVAAAWVALGAVTPLALGLGLLAFSAMRAPIAPLLDSAALKLIVDEGADPRDYGKLRLWGTVGFLVLSGAASLAVEATPDASAALLIAIGAWTVMTLATFALPAVPGAPPAPVWPALWRLARSPFLGPMLLALCLHGLGLTLYDALLAVHLESRGLGSRWVAIALAFGLSAEIGVMALGRRLLDGVGAFPMLVLAAGVGALRWGLTAVVTLPWLLVGLQALHGVSFGLFWIAGVEVMRQHAPEEVRASAQAMLTSTAYGIGALMSSGLIALLLDDGGTPVLFGIAAVAGLLATVGLGIAARRAPAGG